MFAEKDLLPGGRGVNREEKAACKAFLCSRLLGSSTLRKRICEFVLTTKQLVPAGNETDGRCAAIAGQLLHKHIASGVYVFNNEGLEGIKLMFADGSCVVLSGRDGVEDRPQTVMWVRPALAALTDLQVTQVRWLVLVNPFTTDGDARPNAYGRRFVETRLEVMCLRGTCGEVWIGGHASCGSYCGEGCSIQPIPLQVFDADQFQSNPRVVPFIDRLNLRIVDEFGSSLFATELELCQLFARYPLNESCAEEMHRLLLNLFRAFGSQRPLPDHNVFAVWVGDPSEELAGVEVDSDLFRALYHARMGRTEATLVVQDLQFAEFKVFTSMVTCSGFGCSWLLFFNPTADELAVILKFASVCSVWMLKACVVVCMLDIDAQVRQHFVQAIYNPPGYMELILEDSDALFGRQSCTIGVGVRHSTFGPEHYSSSRDAEDGEGGGMTDSDSNADASPPDAAVIQETNMEFVEPAAVITPEDAARIAEELWASGLEQRLAAPASAGQPRQILRLLTFHRHPEGMDAAILASPLARALMEEGVDVQPCWANGAKVLAPGVTPEDVLLELYPRHVICAHGDEESVREALNALPYNQRPRPKIGAGQPKLPSETSLMQDMSAQSSTDGWMSCDSREISTDLYDTTDLPVRNGFICFGPARSISPRTTRTV